MSTEAMQVQRGSCLMCGQTWVYGKLDDEAGMYGEFYCAACWDSRDETSSPPGSNLFCEKPHDVYINGNGVIRTRVGFPVRNRLLSFVSVSRDEFNEPSTGYSLWTGAYSLLNRMEFELKHRHQSGLQGLNILELGAGCGLPGMGLAQLGANVILTDTPQLCRVLEQNVALNFTGNLLRGQCAEGNVCKPHVARLRWGHHQDLSSLVDLVISSGGLDYIIGSEVIYDEESHGSLIRTFEALLSAARKAKSVASTNKVRNPTRILMTCAARPNELETFTHQAAEAHWCLRVLDRIDIPKLTGLPSRSPMVVVEMRPRIKSRQSRSSKRRWQALHTRADEHGQLTFHAKASRKSQ